MNKQCCQGVVALNVKPRYAARFFLTYFCVWFPLLLISIIQTQVTRDNLIRKEEAAVSSQLYLICEELDDLFFSYRSNSISLTNAPELLPHKVTGDYLGAYYGIRYLRSATLYDLYAQDTCLYFGQGKVYSIQGYVGLSTYLSKTLRIQNAADIEAIFESDALAAGCAWRDATSGYLILHCPIRGKSDAKISVNYTIPFTAFSRILGRMSDTQPAYINLIFEDGSTVHYDGHNNLSLIAPAAYETDTAATHYTTIRRPLDSMGMAVEIVYNPDEIYADVNSAQHLNTLLVLLGVVASTIASVFLSQNRSKKIRSIEEMAGLPMEDAASTRSGVRLHDEYAHIQSIIRLAQQETSDLRSSQQMHAILLKQQTLQLIFHSYFKGRDAVNHVLSLGEMELFEENYFVGGIQLPPSTVVPGALWARFAAELCCAESVKGRTTFFFLLEIPNADLLLELRKNVVEEMKRLLVQTGIPSACLAVSQAYQDIYDASYAYQEVLSLLEQTQGGPGYEVKYWEYAASAPSGAISLDAAGLERFLTAVEERDPDAAAHALRDLNQSIAASGQSQGSQRYLRYCILQPLIALVQTQMPDISSAFVDAIVRMDPSDGLHFEENVNRLLGLYLPPTQRQDNFQRVLDFIRDNYADCNLTAELVAEYGGFSKAYLSRLFKARTQLTYIEYLTHVRMNKAKELLRSTDLSIREIVGLVGYVDDSSFRRKFKALYGTSAMEYRNRKHEV